MRKQESLNLKMPEDILHLVNLQHLCNATWIYSPFLRTYMIPMRTWMGGLIQLRPEERSILKLRALLSSQELPPNTSRITSRRLTLWEASLVELYLYMRRNDGR